MAWTGNQLAPAMSMQQAIDRAFIDERAPTLARRFESDQPQGIVAGNDAPYGRDPDASVLGNLFREA